MSFIIGRNRDKGALVFWGLVAVCLSIATFVQISPLQTEAPTRDEPSHLVAGYAGLISGDFRIDPNHPPLVRELYALPLLLFKPQLPLNDPGWISATVDFGDAFVRHNAPLVEKIFLAARSVTVVLSLLLALSVAWYTKSHFGRFAGIVALFFVITDPNLTAHGRYVTTDVPITLLFFLATITWARFLTSGKVLHLVVAGVLLSAALLSKFSALLLLPLFVLLACFRAWQSRAAVHERTNLSLRRFAIATLVLIAVSGSLILGFYAIQVAPPKSALAPPDELASSAVTLSALTDTWIRPARPFLEGLLLEVKHNNGGHPGYVLGTVAHRGRWYYFPVVFGVKTPTAALLLAVVALAMGLARLRLGRLRQAPFAWMVATLALLFYFAAAMTSGINLGVRHLLPIYPFLAVLLGAVTAALWRRRSPALRVALALAACIQIAESARIYPHHLAFFNTLAGGPEHGTRYLLDSNIDWGQDGKNLRNWMDANRVPRICATYFGSVPLSLYGIHFKALPDTGDPREWDSLNCIAAVSVTPLFGLYAPAERFAYLRSREPMAKIGHSIYLYDLRKPQPDVPLDPAEHGVYGNDHPGIRYSGWWLQDQVSPYTMSSPGRYSNYSDDSIRFSFRGTEVGWLCSKGPNRGMAEVTIDGVPKAVVDLYSPDRQWRTHLRFQGLEHGDHTLQIRVLSARNRASSGNHVDIDGLVVGPLRSAPRGFYDNTDPRVEYYGWWFHDRQFSEAARASLSYSNGAGNSIRFAFHGSVATWIFTRAPNRGKAVVSLDGVNQRELDLYSPDAQWQSKASFAARAAGDHTLEIRILESTNPAATERFVDVDAFEVR